MTAGAKPFLKWVGGKRQLLPELLARAPKVINTYVEPFMGGGALFFELFNEQRFKRAYLCDRNAQLANAYMAVKQNLPGVLKHLEVLAGRNTEEDFEAIRRTHNASWLGGRLGSFRLSGTTWDIEAAAWFIYLNKAGYGGVCRYNQKGEFNVPFGRYKSPTIRDEPTLTAAAEALRHTSVSTADFAEVVAAVQLKPGDFVYFDPPYIPVSSTAAFTQYVASAFGPEQQARLSNLARELAARGVGVLLSNSDTPAARALYTDSVFKVETVQARRTINSNTTKRGAVGELLISANL